MNIKLKNKEKCDKITTKAKQMRELFGAQCKELCTMIHDIDEIQGCESQKDVKNHLDAMLMVCALACDHFNKLRSLLALMEVEVQVDSPKFYVKEYTITGCPPPRAGCCIANRRGDK